MTQPRLLGGRYELDGVVGRGGMAEVYRARDIRLDRIVAIKTLRADLARDQIFQARFRREAQSAASLNHPSIVAVYDTGEDMATGVPVPYIVMEYVDGRTVRDLLQEGHRLLPERSLEIIDGVLRALEYSHQAGIVHRDIKPGNVMITRNGEIKVMDFGIARAVSNAQTTKIRTAQVIGTVKYMSPEQAKGEQVDSRGDIYSAGCFFYELLTGDPPFTGDTPRAIAYQQIMEDPVPPCRVDPDVPPWADTIILKAMAKSPNSRYLSATEMRHDLQRAASGTLRIAVNTTSHQAKPGASAPGRRNISFSDALANTTTVTGTWNAPTSIDIEVRIPGTAVSNACLVEIRGSEGEVTVPANLPDPKMLPTLLNQFSMAVDTARLGGRLAGEYEYRAVCQLGSVLFDALFPDRARMLYYACRSASRRLGNYLRLVLRIGPPDLASLPWEFMWDRENGVFPCLEHPLVRYVEQPLPTETMHTPVPVRFLGMIAAPRDQPELHVEQERAAVERTLHTFIEHGQVRLDWVKGENWSDLQRKLYKRQYNIFHFVGHGGFAKESNQGYLAFTGPDGCSDRVPASDVAAIFAGQHQLKLAILNSCESARGDGQRRHTSVAGALVRQGLTAVLAMQDAVSDPVATCFATSFYDALAAEMTIDLAAMRGRQAVKRSYHNSLEWGNPILYLRSREKAHFLSFHGG
jgi:serine/threonine protein kinase